MTIRVFSLLVFVSLFSCTKKPNPTNKFVGTWYDTEYIIPNKSVLKIHKDSTFSYHSAGCMWRSISKGNWKMIGNSIELNSTSSDTCYKMFPFLNCKPLKENSREDQLTIPNCTPKDDASFATFSKETFYLKNDSLVYKLKANSTCPDTLRIVFARTEKIRK